MARIWRKLKKYLYLFYGLFDRDRNSILRQLAVELGLVPGLQPCITGVIILVGGWAQNPSSEHGRKPNKNPTGWWNQSHIVAKLPNYVTWCTTAKMTFSYKLSVWKKRWWLHFPTPAQSLISVSEFNPFSPITFSARPGEVISTHSQWAPQCERSA